MKERLVSGIIIIAIVALVLYVGGFVFDIGISLLAICSFYELMTAKKDVFTYVYKFRRTFLCLWIKL